MLLLVSQPAPRPKTQKLTHPVPGEDGVQHAHEGAGVRHHVCLTTRRKEPSGGVGAQGRRA